MHRHADRRASQRKVSCAGVARARGDPTCLSMAASITAVESVTSGINDNNGLRTAAAGWTGHVTLSFGFVASLALLLAMGMTAANSVWPGNGRADDTDSMGGSWLRLSRDRFGRRSSLPVHRRIFAVDIERSTQRTNPVKEELRQQVYRLLARALDAAGITDRYRDPFSDFGDGVLVLIHPADDVPKPVLLTRLIPALAELISRRNDDIPSSEPSRLLRLRAVIHAGEVHNDGNGFFGEDVDVAFRLLDARRFKTYFRKAKIPLGLVVSDEIYWSVIHHGYDGIDGDEFRSMVVTVGGRRRKGWIQLPGDGMIHIAEPGNGNIRGLPGPRYAAIPQCP